MSSCAGHTHRHTVHAHARVTQRGGGAFRERVYALSRKSAEALRLLLCLLLSLLTGSPFPLLLFCASRCRWPFFIHFHNLLVLSRSERAGAQLDAGERVIVREADTPRQRRRDERTVTPPRRIACSGSVLRHEWSSGRKRWYNQRKRAHLLAKPAVWCVCSFSFSFSSPSSLSLSPLLSPLTIACVAAVKNESQVRRRLFRILDIHFYQFEKLRLLQEASDSLQCALRGGSR